MKLGERRGRKQNAWAEHYERLLTLEFDWDPDHLSNKPPLEGLPIPIAIDMVKKAISKMKSGKAAGSSGIVVEMIKAAGDTDATMIRDLATAIIRDGKVPSDWELLPVLTSRHLSYKTCGHVYSSCVQSTMLHASETWPLTKTTLQRNDRALIRQICSIKPEDVATVRSRVLLAKLELENLGLILKEKASPVWVCGAF